MPIVITIYAILLCLPAAILTWFSFEEGVMGCGAIAVQVLGLPGTILIALVRLIMYLFKLPKEIKRRKEQEEREKQVAEERIRHQKQEENRQKAYQAELDKKRKIIYPNSPVTREIVNLITNGNEYPYSIEINHSGLTFHFENRTSSYILRSHGLPNFDLNEERIFAEVLNAKLSYKYTIRDNSKDSFHQYGDAFDGFVDVISTHISTIMELKISRSF